MDPCFNEIQEYLKQFGGGTVALEKNCENGIATIRFANPTKKNAITGAMMIDLRRHILSLERWHEGKAVIICGEGNFCSGGDLHLAKESGNAKGALYISKWMQDTLLRLHKLPLISVCLLSGPCLGGGAEVSVFCDYLLASTDVAYGFVHARMNIVPAYGGGSRLIQKIGYQNGLDLLLTSKILTADDCLRLKLVEKVIPKENAYEETLKWTLEKVKHHYSVTRGMKQIAVNVNANLLEEALKYEGEIFRPFWGCERNKLALESKIKHL